MYRSTIITTLAFCFSTCEAFAQIPDILIEACASLPNASDRAKCIKTAALGFASAQPKGGDASDDLDRAFAGLEGALEAGTLSLIAYQEQVLEVSKALGIFERRVKDRPEAVAILKGSVEAYGDARTLWNKTIDYCARTASWQTDCLNTLSLGNVGLEWMVEKYNIATPKRGSFASLMGGVRQSDALRSIWKVAKSKSDVGLEQIRNQY